MGQHTAAILIIGLVAGLVAFFVAPADPVSTLIDWVLVGLVSGTAYVIGFRRGRQNRSGE